MTNVLKQHGAEEVRRERQVDGPSPTFDYALIATRLVDTLRMLYRSLAIGGYYVVH